MRCFGACGRVFFSASTLHAPLLRRCRSISTGSGANLQKPSWIAQLCSDAQKSEKTISCDVKVYDELSWRRRRFSFDKELWDPARMSSIVRRRLCLGNEEAEYTVIGEAFAFADREDSPVVNEPQRSCKLLWDHNSSVEKLLIQISDHFPPLLWYAVKPTLESLKRIFSEFLDVDAEHMKKNLPYYESVQNAMETSTQERLGVTLSPTSVKDRFVADMRRRDPKDLELDYPCEYSVFLGTSPHFRLVEDRMMKSNPFVFGWPLLLSDGNEHLDGTPLRMAAFRTVYSKSLLMFHTRLDLQVDHRLASSEAGEETLLDVPIFCNINYPKNTRLCGGKPLVQRFNTVMGTTYPLDTPVDILAALAKEQCVKGPNELLEELRFLTAAAERAPDEERVFRISDDQLSANRIVGQLAYTIIYVALVNYDRFIKDVFDVYKTHRSDMVRVACARGASIVGRPDLIEQLISAEREGPCKNMLRGVVTTP
ncbi:hypothetical protein, conserved [Trypanosoma brucei gambiense DAL972]|uniref:Uncharacterized protein n=2 Tax=Trypanosoma brucei TaxID=5691 RepID=C9ZN08_TRYB9|nr:hypothetical protein, conserved [Trypanosoma brucei gambiense DAL972]RHW72959.1 hypothetical protein DPX39_040040000 [Trypanosoma brucei equiperdum]CBH10662.1 hypothetical protein, conserved [Trypanosoma brucei gambiense DAL972]|eukprot:XP_011772950.1 hypothetical protein, conserved [Trypanosoma brucei gambiense DAL972]